MVDQIEIFPESSILRSEFMIKKAVIPAAGLGTRLLSSTKEQPKEMLPVFCRGIDGSLRVKPLVQLVFEQLHDAGIREYCFIVGRGKRAIEDHFTPDFEYLQRLNNIGKNSQALELQSFYSKLSDSIIIWINQPQPKGFGHAVLLARPFVGPDEFLVHAGDTYIISNKNNHLARLVNTHRRLKGDATFLVQEVPDPRQYGIIEGVETEYGYKVTKVVEKPDKPTTNLAIMPIYIFTDAIFRALEVTPFGKGGEIQLTDAIQKLIDWGLNVNAIKLNDGDIRLDIGTPETFWEAQKLSYQKAIK